jgi:hypothetical protein
MRMVDAHAAVEEVESARLPEQGTLYRGDPVHKEVEASDNALTTDRPSKGNFGGTRGAAGDSSWTARFGLQGDARQFLLESPQEQRGARLESEKF